MTFRVMRTNQYNQDLGLNHSTNGNHLESPEEGSSIDHQVTIYLHAQNITMFPTNETWSEICVDRDPVVVIVAQRILRMLLEAERVTMVTQLVVELIQLVVPQEVRSFLPFPLPTALSPTEIVLPVKIWHHTFTTHMANQIKRRNVSSLTYENFPGVHPSQYCSHPFTLNSTRFEDS
ncbi:phosphoglycerate kinase, chloroplastic-like [Dorcoceras hygrometricum]|uniref:Phosphoglycerate kinase, chloroplastic-like n=1 Tax=Dorcoceras hygrometricum TaxID=472368 RepID=A0A2Z7C2N8_9LAMI|nr:phosphoglycerate kinase, chloroplastic-like [Dorcoceras hygrometricum]